jgi:hypothetical protein
MKSWWQRIRARWWIIRHHGDSINRRAVVEKYLFDACKGTEPLPDKEKCRELALKLGVPTNWDKKK